MWLETEHAWYILERPAKSYEALYKMFLKPIRIAQFAVSSLLLDRQQDIEKMRLDKLQNALCDQSTSDCRYYEEDLTETVSTFNKTLSVLYSI